MKALILAVLMVAPISVNAWYCESYGSDGAMGWGESYSLRIARNTAMYNCRKYTTTSCSVPTCW